MVENLDYPNIGRWFGILDSRSDAYIVHACADIPLSFYEYILLFRLYEHEGASQEFLAEYLMVDKAVVTRTLKTLEDKGFIERVQNQEDKRSKCVYTTAKGKAKRPFLESVLKTWIDYLSEDLDEDTVNTLLNGLKVLAEKAKNVEFTTISAKLQK